MRPDEQLHLIAAVPVEVDTGDHTDDEGDPPPIKSATKSPCNIWRFGLVLMLSASVVFYYHHGTLQDVQTADVMATTQLDRWEDETSSSCSSAAGCCATPVTGEAECTKTIMVQGDYIAARNEGKAMTVTCPSTIDLFNPNGVIAILTCSTDDSLKKEAVKHIMEATATESGAENFRNAAVPLMVLTEVQDLRHYATRALDRIFRNGEDHLEGVVKAVMEVGLPARMMSIMMDESASDFTRDNSLGVLNVVVASGNRAARKEMARYLSTGTGLEDISEFLNKAGNAWSKCQYESMLSGVAYYLKEEDNRFSDTDEGAVKEFLQEAMYADWGDTMCDGNNHKNGKIAYNTLFG